MLRHANHQWDEGVDEVYNSETATLLRNTRAQEEIAHSSAAPPPGETPAETEKARTVFFPCGIGKVRVRVMHR